MKPVETHNVLWNSMLTLEPLTHNYAGFCILLSINAAYEINYIYGQIVNTLRVQKKPFALRTASIHWGIDSTRSWKRSTGMLTHVDSQCIPQLCQVGWMSFGGRTILDTHRKLLSVENPAALQFVTHSNRCAWHLPVQRHLNMLSWPFTLWMAHIHNPCHNCLKA